MRFIMIDTGANVRMSSLQYRHIPATEGDCKLEELIVIMSVLHSIMSQNLPYRSPIQVDPPISRLAFCIAEFNFRNSVNRPSSKMDGMFARTSGRLKEVSLYIVNNG